MEGVHGFLAMAPCRHLVGQAFQELLAVLLRRDGMEPGFFEVARFAGFIVVVVVGQVDADVALPFANQRRERPKPLRSQNFCHNVFPFKVGCYTTIAHAPRTAIRPDKRRAPGR